MQIVDIIILVVVGLGILVGLKTGLIRQVVGLAGLVGAFILAFIFMENVAALLIQRLDISVQIASITGFAVVFLGVQVGVLALTRLLQTVIGALKLNLFNRALGGALGGFSAVLVLSILFNILAPMGVPSTENRFASKFYEPVSDVLPGAWGMAVSVFPGIMELSDRFLVEP